MGRKAASVLPVAVAAAMITSVTDLFGQMDATTLGGIIAQAMTLAECAGRTDVMDGQ